MTASPSLLLIRQKYTPYGGAERFVERAMAALVEQGVSLSLLTREWQGAAEGVEVIPCRPFYLGRLWRDKSFHRAACGKVEELAPSLVQSHERIPCCDIYRAGDGLHGQWLHHKKRASGPLTRLALDWSPYHRYVLQAEERLFTSPRLKAVICNSYMVQKEIRQRFKLPDAMLPVIYSGVDSERFHPRLREARQRMREAWGIPQQAVVFLFVGSGFKRKGMDILLKTFATLPDNAWLWVVGKDRQQWYYQWMARRLGIGARVCFTGGQQKVDEFYGAADAAVLPTLYDPFPNVAMEAMASGLPMATTLSCGAKDLIQHGANGLLADALDQEKWQQNLHTLMDEQKRQTMGQLARQSAEPLTMEVMGLRLLSLYQALYAGGLRDGRL